MKITSYGEWESAYSPEAVFSATVGFSELLVDGDDLYWLEMRPAEGGRYAIVKKNKAGEIQTVLPQPYNVRNRVHEYGGGSYTVRDGIIYFVNYADERIYRIGKESIIPVTPEKNSDGSLGKYASLIISPNKEYLVFVYEKEFHGKQNENYLAMIKLSETMKEPTILSSGRDFYADPCFSDDGKKIAWLEWDLPWMPWDNTDLLMAEFGPTPSSKKKIAGGDFTSICLPRFHGEELYFIMDNRGEENYWNIYKYNSQIVKVTNEESEFGTPHWLFGQSTYAFLQDGSIAACMIKEGEESLVRISGDKIIMLDVPLTYFDYFSSKGNILYFIGGGPYLGGSIYSVEISDHKAAESLKLIKKNSTIELDKDNISVPEHISYPTSDGEIAHAFFYLPKNKKYRAPPHEKPPLIVIGHGGPTSATEKVFSFIIQYWTSMGYAVADVNYRGSTGYGRKYRDKLLGNWGIVDADDTADVVRYLVAQDLVDKRKVAVRGGSAGGYLVQRLLTRHPSLFSAGASYFGIGNLLTMEETTHKFEGLYTDILIDARLPSGIERFRERSPINYLHNLKSPMIIFQGSEDKIVPPQCSREMADILKEKGIPYEYIEYEGEAHGFRTKKNNVDSLLRESAFYRKVMFK